MQDAEFFKSRGFGQAIGFGERAAILSIDYMLGFTDENQPLGSNLDKEIAVARKVLDAARENGVPIFHTIVQYDQEDLSDAGIWGLKMAGSGSLRANSREVTLDPRIGYRPGESIIIKKYASAFFGTDLLSRLLSKRVDTIILVGCTTSGCVRASAVDAIQSGFRPIVVKEAVGDRSAAAHAQALFDLQQKYADVLGADEVVGWLRGHKA